MRKYGQFCPIAKSAEILGDPWSILIVRELLLGSTRFSVLQKGPAAYFANGAQYPAEGA